MTRPVEKSMWLERVVPGLLFVLALGCMPDRRNNDPATPAEESDVAADAADAGVAADAGDAGLSETADGAVDTADAASATDAKKAAGCTTAAHCQVAGLHPCFQATCDAATGVCGAVALPDGATCGVADACVKSRTCLAGTCKSEPVDCDDDKPCTADGCTLDDGCTNLAKTAWCDDGDACTAGDQCSVGSCTGKPIACKDFIGNTTTPNPCTTDSCDKTSGCLYPPVEDTVKCDDGDATCTTDDTCAAGVCKGKAVVCKDDKNPCTLEICIAKNSQGCSSEKIDGQPCDDGKPCTEADSCGGGTCSGTAGCNDGNPCTDDVCDATIGCTHKDNVAPCTGSGPCVATSGTCKDGACSTAVKNCDDGNVCTNDDCDAATGGCKATAKLGNPCSDGDACTESDACDGTTCKAGAKAKCDDGNPCTVDSCVTGKGCKNAAAAPGASCGTDKQCVVGLCLDNNACGDGLCAQAETSETCPADCPESGGECVASDLTCIDACTGAKCAKPQKACTDMAGCSGLQACLAKCDDAKCDQGCFLAVKPAVIQAFLGANACVQAFCVQDSWIGKKCQGGGLGYTDCIAACTAAVCPVQDSACKADTTCSAIIDCVDACKDGDSACVQKCGVSDAKYDARVVCAQGNCL